MTVSEEQVWGHPDDEDCYADGNAGQRGAGTEREVGPGEGSDQRADDEEAHRVQPLGRQRDHAFDRHDADESKKRRNVGGRGAPAGIDGWQHVRRLTWLVDAVCYGNPTAGAVWAYKEKTKAEE